MSHLDSTALSTYNSLVDPHLQCYFSNERIRSHLKHAGLISRRGEIVSDSDYRLKLARRDHKKHVRQMLAENIVHRAIDMERTRQAELKRQYDLLSKAAVVNSVKESRRRVGRHPSTKTVSNSNDMGLLSMNSSWSQSRPKSATHHHEITFINEEFGEQPRIPRVHSAHVNGNRGIKISSKSPNRRQRHLNRPKSMSAQRSSPIQRSRSPTKHPDSSLPNLPCQITMVYYGPHTKIDYDHSLFEPVDEIIVMQQHCGGENLIVYKANLKAGDEFTFNSRRHADYPLGLSLYVKGLIDSRISTCCEYKHRHGVRLGGERGHFAIVSVEGSKPCLKCRFEKQEQLKQYANSPKDLDETDHENKKAITISIPASDEPKTKQTPVKIPVRHTSDSNDNYSEDFDGSDKQKTSSKNGYSSDTSASSSHSSQPKAKPSPQIRPSASPIAREKSPTETSSTSTITPKEHTPTKTWQIIFHTSNIPTGSLQLPKTASHNAFLKVSLLSTNGKDETEKFEIELKEFPQYFKSGRQDLLRTKFRDIGKPQQIRLILDITGHDNDDIKWHLDHVELIDLEGQSHYKFPCNQWIRPSKETILNLLEASQRSITRKTSTSTNSSISSSDRKKRPQPSTTIEQKAKVSSRSSSSSSLYESPKRSQPIQKSVINPARRISTDNESNNQENKIHYRVMIYPSNDNDGEFNALNDSRMFIRLNNQKKDTFIEKDGEKSCPSFESGESQTFEIDLIQNTNEQPTMLTIGYINSDIAAGKWKLQKIVLINTETGEETVFPCKDALVRNDFNLRAEKTFQAQSTQCSDDDEKQSTPRHVKVAKIPSSRSESEEDLKSKAVQPIKQNRSPSSSSESIQQVTTEKKNKEKYPSNRSLIDEDENDYKKIFNGKDSHGEEESSSSSNPSPSRPKTRRGVQDNFDKTNEQEEISNKKQTNSEIWRPSSERDKNELVDPLIGLDDLNNQTARSNDQQTQKSLPSTTTSNPENQFKDWYPKDSDEDD